MPALKVNIIIVHPWDVVFLRAIDLLFILPSRNILDHDYVTDIVSALAIWITVPPVISNKSNDR
jgi:hypothetical protein